MIDRWHILMFVTRNIQNAVICEGRPFFGQLKIDQLFYAN